MSQSFSHVLECAMHHMEDGIAIADLDLTAPNKKRLVRAFDLYYRWIANRHLDPKAMLRELWPDLDRYGIRQDLKVFYFILEQSEPGCRKMDELKVRGLADDMARIGRAQGDWKPLEAAAKIITKVGQLDKPEQPADPFDRVAFLPTIFTTNIKDIDPDRPQITSEMQRQLAAKYGGIIDEHGALIERRKAEMQARATIDEEDIAQQSATLEEESPLDEPAAFFGTLQESPVDP